MAARKDYWRLKEVLNLPQLEKLFRYFSSVTGLDTGLFDFAGFEILAEHKKNSVCTAARNCSQCRERISYGGLLASELGEPYICSCGCGLIMCFIPVMFNERLIGTIACGPALLWDADEVAASEFLDKTRRMGLEVNVRDVFGSIVSCNCFNMTSAAQVLFIIVNSLTREHSLYLDQRSIITRQQAKIAELIIDRKNHDLFPGDEKKGPVYPAEKEKELINLVENGSLEQARKALNILLGEIFIYADGKIDTMRVRVYELFAFLSRAATETGAPLSEINRIINDSLKIFNEEIDFEQLCFLARQSVEEFIGRIFNTHEKNELNDHLSRAIDYISVYYEDELTLQKVSDAIFVSSSYLSHLFRNELNITFSDYLSRVRITMAKKLLKNSKFMRIQEVALKTGFNDPNYFAKSFRKITGVTPKEYRTNF